MIIIGVDPSSIRSGVGVIEKISRDAYRPIFYKDIKLSKNDSHPIRIKRLYDDLNNIINLYKPERMSLETIFYGKNVQSALKLGQIRGAIIALAMNKELNVSEFSPREVKRAITGNGNASKESTAFMVRRLLNLSFDIQPDDVTDALALAICDAYSLDKKIAVSKKETWAGYIEKNPHKILNGK